MVGRLGWGLTGTSRSFFRSCGCKGVKITTLRKYRTVECFTVKARRGPFLCKVSFFYWCGQILPPLVPSFVAAFKYSVFKKDDMIGRQLTNRLETRQLKAAGLYCALVQHSRIGPCRSKRAKPGSSLSPHFNLIVCCYFQECSGLGLTVTPTPSQLVVQELGIAHFLANQFGCSISVVILNKTVL